MEMSLLLSEYLYSVWSPDMANSTNIIGKVVAIKGSAIIKAADGSQHVLKSAMLFMKGRHRHFKRK